MSKLAVAVVIYKKNKRPEELATIAIRVTYDRKSRFKETDFRCRIMDFNEKTGIIGEGYSNFQFANASIGKLKNKIEMDLLMKKEDPGFCLQTIEDYLRPEAKQTQESLTRYVQAHISDLQKKVGVALEKNYKPPISPGTLVNYNKALNKLHEFAGKENVSFSEITPAFLERYETWLLLVRKNKPNTVYDSLTKFIHKFFEAAKKPVPDFDWPGTVETNPTYLTLDELDCIEAILPNLTEFEYMDAVYFLVECYAGIRHCDWGSYRIERLIEQDNFKVRARKNGEPIYLSLTNRPRLRNVLELAKVMPYTSSLFNTNKNLRIVSAMAGIKKKVTTHVGRHTCAVLHAERGFSKEYVAELLGITIQSVEVYYKITRQKLRREDERLQGL